MNIERRSLIKKFLFIAIPLVCLWTLVMYHNEELDKKQFVSQTINESINSGNNSSILITDFIAEIVENFRLFSTSDEVVNYIDNKSEINKSELSKLFAKTLKNKSEFTRITYVKFNGNELVDISKIDESIYEKTDNELINISENSLYKEFVANGSNQIYMSSLAVDSQSQTIGTDFNSKLTFLIPLFGDSNKPTGMILIDYHVNDILRFLRYSSQFSDNASCFCLYDAKVDGAYSLKYKYLLPGDCQENKATAEIESLIDLIGEKTRGYIQTKDSLIIYQDVVINFNDIGIINSDKWVLVNSFNISDLFSFHPIRNYLFSIYGLFLLLILSAAFILAKSLNRLKINESELSISNRIAETTTDAVVVTDNKMNISFVNESVEDCSSYSMDELVGKNPYVLISKYNNPNLLEKARTEIGKTSSWNGYLWFNKRNGILYPNKLNIFKMENKSSENHYIGIFSELTNSQVRNASNKLDYKESNLTVDMLRQIINKDEKYIVLYIALDNYNNLVDLFKDLNLKILDSFVDLIVPFKKEGDVIAKAGKNKVFVVLNITNIEESAYDYVQALYGLLSKMMHIGDSEACFRTRIGASIYPEDTRDIKRLYKNTLLALQCTSMVGAKNISFYNPDMLEKINKEREIEYHLRMAIAKDELHMVYQPQVNIKTGNIVGMEALIRWNCAILGTVSPAVFIPIAEKNRMMIDLGKWILERTCSDLNYLFNTVGVDSSLKCAINISVMQFEDNGFLDNLYSIIEKNNLSYSNIELEITENLFLEQSPSKIAILEDISRKGISIAIDDFGTGYSSLAYLNKLPVDKIKIDRGFIKNYPTADDGELAKILIQMSKTLNKEVLTEGAETEEQIAYLKGIGCEYIQGYYYSKPLERTNLIDYINK